MATNLTLGTLFTADIRDFIRGVSQIRTALNSLHQSMAKAGSGASAMGKGMASGLNATTAAINKQNASIKASSQQLTGLAGMWQRVQQAMKTSLAYGTAGAAIYTVIDGLKNAITTVVEYDQALKNLQAITEATDDEMVGLADTLKSVASKYVYSTKEISDGMVLMGQAGFSATQTMQAMDSAAKLSMGTLEDMALTVDLLTTSVVAFNMSSVESERVADIMANAMNKSKLTLDKLRVAFNYVGNIAHEAGISLEETAAAMSVMSNSGMRASTIGTSLRQVLSNILAPNRRLREEFQGLGIDLSQLDPKIVGFNTVLQNLSKILINQKTGLVDMTKAYNLFGLRAAQAAAILARSSSDAYPRMLSMMYEVGSATKMADKQMEGLVARFKNLAVNAQLIAIAIGEGGVINVMRMLTDALLWLTKAVKNFVESDAGKLTSSFVAWSVAAGVATLAFKGLVAFIMGPMINALIRFAKDLKNAIILMTAMQGISIADKINTLLAVLTRGGPIFLAYAAAIGAVIAAYAWWKGSEERQVEALVKTSNAFKTAADTLDSYQTVLTKLAIKQEKGQDISVEYEAAIKRLIRAYPQLKGVIDENIGSLDKNIKKIAELKQLTWEKEIQKQIDLLRIYDKQLLVTASNIEKIKAPDANYDNFNSEIKELEANIYDLSSSLNDVSKNSDDVVESFTTVVEAESKMSKEAQKTAKIMQDRDQSFVNIAKIYKKLGESVESITEKLKALGATDTQVKTAMEAIKSYTDEFSKDLEEIDRAMANLPHMFTNFFDSLDAGSKVAFAKAAKSMEDEVSNYKKIAATILKTEEDRYAAEAFIRSKHLLKFADDMMKEKMTSEQLLNFKKNLLEEEKKIINERIEVEIRGARDRYEVELKQAGENEVKRKEAQERFQAALLELRKKGSQAIIAIAQAENLQVVDVYKKASEEVVKTGRKMADDYLKELQSLVNATEKEVEKLEKARLKSQEGMTDKIRGLKQKGMSDSQKFADDEKRINELLEKARSAGYKKNYDDAKSYYDKASDISESLARDIKNAQGETIRSETETTAAAIRYLEQIKTETDELYRKQIEQEKQKAEEAKTVMAQLTDLLKSYGGEWDKINQQKLDEFISNLNEVIERSEKLSGITSTIRKDWEVMTNNMKNMPKPQQPSYGAQPGLQAVQKPPTGEGTITVGGKTYDVGALSGGEGTGTMTVGGKTYDVGGETQGSGTISFGGKTFDVNKLSEYYNKVENLTNDIHNKVQEAQVAVVEGVQRSGQEATAAVQQSTTGIVTAIQETAANATTAAADSTQALKDSISQITTDTQNMSLQIGGMGAAWQGVYGIVVAFKTLLTEVKTTIDELAASSINELITKEAVDLLDKAKGFIVDIKKDWDSLQSKTITLTIKTVQSGGGGSSGGGDNSEGGSDANWAIEYRHGGLVGKIDSFYQGIKAFASGGKLPGYGGGDRQIIAAESGEFVVNKESTRRFLPVIEAINSNSVSVNDLGKRFGGIIKKLPAFKSGGRVADFSMPDFRLSASTGQPIQFHFHTMYMSGDKATARRFACEVQQQLDDLNKRRGRR
jgi:TP901 family phage tail tape measure protein